jgi:hypothetical protein
MGAAKRARRAEAIRRKELEKLPSVMFIGTAYRGVNISSKTFTMPLMVTLENGHKDRGTSMPQGKYQQFSIMFLANTGYIAVNTVVAKTHVIESLSQARNIQVPVAKAHGQSNISKRFNYSNKRLGTSSGPDFDPMIVDSIKFAPSMSKSRLLKSRRVCSKVGFPPTPSVVTQMSRFQVLTAAAFSISNDDLAQSLRAQPRAIVFPTTPIGILHLPNRTQSPGSLAPDTVSQIVAKFVKPVQGPLPQRSIRPRNVTYDMTLHRAAKWFLEPKEKKSGFDMTLHRVASWFREPKVNVANCGMTLYRAGKWFLEPKPSTCKMSFDATADWFIEHHEQEPELKTVYVMIMNAVKEPSLDAVNQPQHLSVTAESRHASSHGATDIRTVDVTPLSKTEEQVQIKLDCAKPLPMLVSHSQGGIVPSKDVAFKTTEAASAVTQDPTVSILPTTPSTKDITVLTSENVSKPDTSRHHSSNKKNETLDKQKSVPAWVRLSTPVARRSVLKFFAKPGINDAAKPIAFRVPGPKYRPVDTKKPPHQAAVQG